MRRRKIIKRIMRGRRGGAACGGEGAGMGMGGQGDDRDQEDLITEVSDEETQGGVGRRGGGGRTVWGGRREEQEDFVAPFPSARREATFLSSEMPRCISEPQDAARQRTTPRLLLLLRRRRRQPAEGGRMKAKQEDAGGGGREKRLPRRPPGRPNTAQYEPSANPESVAILAFWFEARRRAHRQRRCRCPSPTRSAPTCWSVYVRWASKGYMQSYMQMCCSD